MQCNESDNQPEACVFTSASGQSLPYLRLKPIDYDPSRRYPLVIYYHGAGQRGSDNRQHWTNGVEVFAAPENRKKHPCFFIAPQCPLGQQWVDASWALDRHTMPLEPSRPLRLSFELIDSMQAEFAVDAERVYVTGISMGGFGTWDAIARDPGRFAAAVPVCGGGDEATSDVIKSIPIWAFHGADDLVVKTDRSRNMIAALRATGGQPRYTEYPNVAHNSWVNAYREPALLDWLFSQSKATR